jgi:phage-related protein
MYNYACNTYKAKGGVKWMNVHSYVTANGKDLISEFINSLNPDEKAEGFYILEKLENGSVEDLNKLDVKHFDGKIWEIRFRKHNRLFYVLKRNEDIFLLYGCKKQKNKTELKDRNLAIKRANEIK